MHCAILVVGENPVERATNINTPMGTTDWACIGGRYTGQMPALPDATTAVVYGDSLPDFEAWVIKMMGDDAGRPTHRGDGYDQMRRVDLDIHALNAMFILDQSGELHGPGYTPDEEGLGMAVAMYRRTGLGSESLNIDEAQLRETLTRMDAKGQAWDQWVADYLTSLPGDVLITMVDVHV